MVRHFVKDSNRLTVRTVTVRPPIAWIMASALVVADSLVVAAIIL